MFECTVCGKPDSKYFRRCEEHYYCDDCGTRDDLCTHTEGVLCGPCHKKRVAKRMAEFDGDTGCTNEVTCPHCGYEFSDSWEMSEGEHECPDCDNTFEIERHVEVTYATYKGHNAKLPGGREAV